MWFQCVNRASGNSIVERCHRTIKRMAARIWKLVHDMVAWYNATPNSTGVIPASTVFAQRQRLPLPVDFLDKLSKDIGIVQTRDLQVGDAVFVKPANATCTTKWRQAVVSGFRKPHQVEIDGVPFHVSHRRVPECGSIMPAEGYQVCERSPDRRMQVTVVTAQTRRTSRH